MSTFILISPDGEKYETPSRVEVTRLKARGYVEALPGEAARPIERPKPKSKS